MHIVGHRGAKGEVAENTLRGFHHLRTLGIHRVELDIRLSKDNELMVLHDRTVDRTSNGRGSVRDFSAEQLQQLNADKAHPQWHPDQGIPTLAAVVQTWPELEHIQCEVKTDDLVTLTVLTQQLARFIVEHNLLQQAVVTSSDVRVLEKIKQINPHIQTGYVAGRFCRYPLTTALQLECHYLVIHYHRCTAPLVEAAQQAHLRLSVWTVNRVNRAKRLQHLGVHQIITDVPALMLPHFHALQAYDMA